MSIGRHAVDVEVARARDVDSGAGNQRERRVEAPTIEHPEYIRCASYTEAKRLAAARRREGMPAYAVQVVALDRWCVRLSAAAERYR